MQTHFAEEKTETQKDESIHGDPGLLTPIPLGTCYVPRMMGDIDTGPYPLEATIWTEINRHINNDQLR